MDENIESLIKTITEENAKLKDEIYNNANCINCGKYGGPYCKRRHKLRIPVQEQSISVYAPCKDWVSENSRLRRKSFWSSN